MDKPSFDTRFFALPGDFSSCITSVHRVDIRLPGSRKFSDALPPELANVRILRGSLPSSRIGEGAELEGADCYVSGPTSQSAQFTMGSARLWGIGIKPCGWARMARTSADDAANMLLDGRKQHVFPGLGTLTDAILAAPPDDEREFYLIAQWLSSLASDSPHLRTVKAVQQALLDPAIKTVEQLGDASATHVRSLERVCRRHFGFPPKLLLRRQRLMRVLADYLVKGAACWTEVIDPQYTDHAQFTREFRHFMGVSPSEYAKFELPLMRAFVKARAKQFGSPVQVLDKS